MIAWIYLVCLASAGLGLLLAGIGICVEAHTNRQARKAREAATVAARRGHPPDGYPDWATFFVEQGRRR